MKNNLLFIHGLESTLSENKKEILAQFGQVYAPIIDYKLDENSIEKIIKQFNSEKITHIIGSSMGGFAGFYIANYLQVPALLFNPALLERSVLQNIPNFISSTDSFKSIVLGKLDRVVPNEKVFQFFEQQPLWNSNVTFTLESEMEHRIPVDLFEKNVTQFFKLLNNE